GGPKLRSVRTSCRPPALARQLARQRQKSAQRRVIIMRQPYGVEVEQLIISGDRPEDDVRKWGRDGGFACETNAEPDRHKVHQCLAADIKPLHTGIVPSVGEPRCNAFTQRGIGRLADNKVLVAKISPSDLFPLGQGVIFREDNKYAFTPQPY